MTEIKQSRTSEQYLHKLQEAAATLGIIGYMVMPVADLEEAIEKQRRKHFGIDTDAWMKPDEIQERIAFLREQHGENLIESGGKFSLKIACPLDYYFKNGFLIEKQFESLSKKEERERQKEEGRRYRAGKTLAMYFNRSQFRERITMLFKERIHGGKGLFGGDVLEKITSTDKYLELARKIPSCFQMTVIGVCCFDLMAYSSVYAKINNRDRRLLGTFCLREGLVFLADYIDHEFDPEK